MTDLLLPHRELIVHSTFDDGAVRRACNRGDLVRLVPGRYVRRAHWDALDDAHRHVMLALAALSCARSSLVLSHASAAALWGFPRLGDWPGRTHAIDPTLSRATTTRSNLKHAAALDDSKVVERFGVITTTPSRTAVDIALSAPLRQAVVALDHGLRVGLFEKDDLWASLSLRQNARGLAKARRAIDFADGRANRPGESLARVVLAECGVPTPDLQHRFRSPNGHFAEVDFWWEEFGIIAEFDGLTKYRDADRWSGLSPSEVVIQEKLREDWLRALAEVMGFVRWTWRDVNTPGRIAAQLAAAGVRW